MADDLRNRLTQIFAAQWKSEGHPQYADMLEKFVFHVSDAAGDLSRFAKALDEATPVDVSALSDVFHRFFLHAVPHLVAAGQLYDYVPEIFAEQRGVHSLPKPSRSKRSDRVAREKSENSNRTEATPRERRTGAKKR